MSAVNLESGIMGQTSDEGGDCDRPELSALSQTWVPAQTVIARCSTVFVEGFDDCVWKILR